MSLVHDKLFALRPGGRKKVILFNQLWDVMNYLRNVVAQMGLSYLNDSAHTMLY